MSLGGNVSLGGSVSLKSLRFQNAPARPSVSLPAAGRLQCRTLRLLLQDQVRLCATTLPTMTIMV